jgi:hypothetical protein
MKNAPRRLTQLRSSRMGVEGKAEPQQRSSRMGDAGKTAGSTGASGLEGP